MTLLDLIPPIPESWVKEPYVIHEDGILEKKPEPKPKKILNAEARDRVRKLAEVYNAKRRQQTAERLAKNQELMRADAVKAMIDGQ